MDSTEWERLNAEYAERIAHGRRTKRVRELTAWRILCRDCDRQGEFYMVNNSTWRSAFRPGETPTGLLCLNCLERRLGRRLGREEIGDGGGAPFDNRLRLRRSERPVF
jgi:hypothetical protein